VGLSDLGSFSEITGLEKQKGGDRPALRVFIARSAVLILWSKDPWIKVVTGSVLDPGPGNGFLSSTQFIRLGELVGPWRKMMTNVFILVTAGGAMTD
jgi:hypothetical protein